MEDQWQRLARLIQNKPNTSELPIKLVAIDGHSGAGKSTLAAKLAELLPAETICADDFAAPGATLEWAPSFMAAVVEPIKAGAQTLSYQPAGDDSKTVQDKKVTPIMIMDGVSSARKEFRPYLSYAIWVEAPREVCLQRGLERDGEEAMDKWQQRLASEDGYIARDDPQGYVDIIVSGI